MGRHKVYWKGFVELKREIFSIRFLAATIMSLALVASMTTGISGMIADTGENITPWMAPHLFSSYDFLGMYGFVICYMYSGIPYMSRQELNGIMRKGRKIWCAERLFVMVLQGFIMTLLTFIFTVAVFLPNVQFENDWGRIIYTLAYGGMTANYDIYSLCYGHIIAEYTPVNAMLMCFSMVFMVTVLMGFIMFALSILFRRIVGVVTAVSLVACQYIRSFFTFKIVIYIAPFTWCNLNYYGAKTRGILVPEFTFYLKLCGMVILVFLVLIAIRVKKIQFDFYNEQQ